MRLYALLILAYFCLALVEAGKANGQKCSKGSKCDSGRCCKIPGKIIKQCQECCFNENCPGEEVCSGFNCVKERSVDPGTLSSNKPNGEICGGDGECASSHCCGFWKRRCRECCNNRDCPTGVCKNNVCFGARCLSNNEVEQLCTYPLKCCKPYWWMTIGECHYCCGNEDCTDPNKPFCVSGECIEVQPIAPAGASCANNPCQQVLTCCPYNKICNQCCHRGLSTECGNNYYCSPGLVCSLKRQAGSSCNDHYECLSNQCVIRGGSSWLSLLGKCA